MSDTRNPPAFPREDTTRSLGQRGMSLRDWFAGQALAGSAADDLGFVPASGIAKQAYSIADAMLAERAKGGEG